MKAMSAARVAATLCTAVGVFVFASSTSANTPRLHLTREGLPVLPPSSTLIRYTFTEGPDEVVCQQSYKGEITNDRPRVTDTLVEPGIIADGCFLEAPFFENNPPGYSIGEGFTKLKLTWNGHVITVGKDRITTPGPCAYILKEVIAAMPVPGLTSFAGEATGALVRRGSLITCPVVRMFPFVDSIYMENTELLTGLGETQLVG
jgi:hypothetical protein